MIVEVGGQMSHGALAARECEIPAVIPVPEVTSKLETSQRICIDEACSTVEVLGE